VLPWNLAVAIFRVEWSWVRMLSDCRQVGKDIVSEVLGMKEEIRHSLDW
jgi:hypothetical protein